MRYAIRGAEKTGCCRKACFGLMRRGLLALFLALLSFPLLSGGGIDALAQDELRAVAPENPVGGNVPGGHLGTSSDADLWKAVRKGQNFTVSIPDKQAGQMIQSDGEAWRSFRNSTLSNYGVYGLIGVLGLLALFFVARGRVRIDAGPSGKTMVRFSTLERSVHWLTAIAFIVLAVTGLNVLYGKYFLLPALGPEIFSILSIGGKYVHNYIAFAFMVGIVMMFLLWVGHNLPSRTDIGWVLRGGGVLFKGQHPPAKKFNAGQKLIFWSVIVGGLALSLTGLALLFPFQIPMFAEIYVLLNILGANLPTELTMMQEMQLSQTWHAIIGLVLIVIMVAHIYIGSIGMEGAFDAMGTGLVDENWAREHHSIWVAEVKGESMPDSSSHGPGGAAAPAE